MTARVFSGSANVPAAVEQFNTGRKRGCIVRWDFEPVKTTIPEVDKRANFRRRKALSRAAKGEQPLPVEELQQGAEVDSGMVAYSEMRYIGIPTPERVLADIVKVEAAAGGSDAYTQVRGYRRPYSGYYALSNLTVKGRAYQVAE